MILDSTGYWRQKIAKYQNEEWAHRPSIFVQEVVSYFPGQGLVLELGCGLGNDGLWLYNNGFRVTQSDLDDFRIKDAKNIPFFKNDISKSLQIDQVFDVVYCHLALHYYTYERTKEIFKEIHRNLSSNGIFAFLVNSTSDPEYGSGIKLEDDYFMTDGQAKRYFDVTTVRNLCQDFEVLLLDDNGSTHKDKVRNVHSLVRSICKKK